jgi:hypothetical protein
MEYLTFVKSLDELEKTQPASLVIKDLSPGKRKYEARYVSAEIFKTAEPGGNTLWIRFDKGLLHPDPFGIKIVQELGPYPTSQP